MGFVRGFMGSFGGGVSQGAGAGGIVSGTSEEREGGRRRVVGFAQTTEGMGISR